MTLTESVKTCLRNYITFSGRASKAEFWKFILFMLLVLFVLVIINSLIFGPELSYRYSSVEAYNAGEAPIATKKAYNDGVLGDIFLLLMLLPWLAVTWRRMHDSGLPGYLPFGTVVVFIIFMFGLFAAYMGFDAFWADLRDDGNVRITNASPSFAGLFICAMLLMIVTNIYLLTRRSDQHPNKYGPALHSSATDPHEVPQ